MTVEEVVREVVKDRVFYDSSGGGVTLSGGEPVGSLHFCIALLSALHAEGIHTCVETSGYGAKEDLLKIARFVDLLLWDIKSVNDEEHYRYTGVHWRSVLDNLMAVDGSGATTILRCPLVKEIHMIREHFDAIAELAVRLRNCRGVQLLPYHSFGTVKAEKIGRNMVMYGTPNRKELMDAREYIAGRIAEQSPACDVAVDTTHVE
jgi:pyruvate-formate lyase-activating enzyme